MTKVSLSVFVCDLQVIVTTPMEMLKIQLQDAGRIGEGYNTIQYNTTQHNFIVRLGFLCCCLACQWFIIQVLTMYIKTNMGKIKSAFMSFSFFCCSIIL